MDSDVVYIFSLIVILSRSSIRSRKLALSMHSSLSGFVSDREDVYSGIIKSLTKIQLTVGDSDRSEIGGGVGDFGKKGWLSSTRSSVIDNFVKLFRRCARPLACEAARPASYGVPEMLGMKTDVLILTTLSVGSWKNG